MSHESDKIEEYNGKNLLARIDERTEKLANDIEEIKLKLEKHYVLKEEFDPIKNLVYGGVGLILIGVLGAILMLIIKGN
ncbi:MAG: hypothetical protein AABY22_30310 [Nanoarchaeota archaeon]